VKSVRAVSGPVFDHLTQLSDAHGLFEHALYSRPRPEHGYCVDDAARAVVVVSREPVPSLRLQQLSRVCLTLTISAVELDGRCHNRMSVDGGWTDAPGVGDWWGRAIWGLGTAAAGPAGPMRAQALLAFRRAARRRSPHRRAMAFAALGAGSVLLSSPDEVAARALLRDAVTAIGADGKDAAWPWPEPRLGYGNASIAEALLLAGEALSNPAVAARGLRLLDFLLRTETRDGHLSVTPVGGRGRADLAPGFDQQPIEVAALADACARAHAMTHDRRWIEGVRMAWAWFLGDNDSAISMVDLKTGAGFDGLERSGRNLNQGAESTLAALSTAQHAQRLGLWL
jgi:hypothetical protein